MKSRAGDWLRQAEKDLAWAHYSMEGAYWSAVCFTCQQVGEKALKAIALARAVSEVRSHSLVKISAALGIDGELEKMGRRLDAFYISARYPDAFPEGAPFEFFDEEQATEALSYAESFVRRARAELAEHG